MEIVDNKAVLIRTRNPAKYTVIPKSKIVERTQDGYTVAVYWGLDEMRVLKNLGCASHRLLYAVSMTGPGVSSRCRIRSTRRHS